MSEYFSDLLDGKTAVPTTPPESRMRVVRTKNPAPSLDNVSDDVEPIAQPVIERATVAPKPTPATGWDNVDDDEEPELVAKPVETMPAGAAPTDSTDRPTKTPTPQEMFYHQMEERERVRKDAIVPVVVIPDGAPIPEDYAGLNREFEMLSGKLVFETNAELVAHVARLELVKRKWHVVQQGPPLVSAAVHFEQQMCEKVVAPSKRADRLGKLSSGLPWLAGKLKAIFKF